ncbi:hypothetical protein QZH41_018604 [Actinostola sp. cb2023]|nr:hypothetical protein QZH41_018604 [Actinostola sp. cb2023]
MSLTMHGAPTRSNPPPYDHRTSASTNGRTARNYTMGSTSSTSSVAQRNIKPTTYNSSYGSSSTYSARRQLPNGPGPLPDKFNLDKSAHGDIRYVSSYSKPDEKFGRSGYSPGPGYGTSQQKATTFERKTSNDSGYGSSSSVKYYTPYTGGNSTSLASRRTKSYSNLNSSLKDLSVKDDPPKYSSSFSTRTVPSYSTKAVYSPGMSSRTKTLENITQLDENSNIYFPPSSSSRLYSDSDPSKSKRHSVTNHFSTNGSCSSNCTSLRKGQMMLDHGSESRKEVITADTEFFRRSSKESTSSSCSSSPNGRGCTDGLVGLRNLGNTCFMNSVLQCLSHSVVLTDYLLKGSHSKHINSRSSMKGKLMHAYADLIKSMWKPGSSDTAISPHSFKTQIQRFAPRFVGYNQQDAQEFLRFLLEGLHDDLNLVHDKPKYKVCEFNDSLSDSEKAEKSWKHYLARDNSLITDVFVGQLKSTLKCTECGYKSATFDPFWDLSLPIPRKSSSSYSSHYDSRSAVTIQDCMDLFTKEEVLDGDERPTCEKCKKKRKSTKQFAIQRFPKILVLHLKRFSGFGFRSKLQTAVEFPTDSRLNLKQFASDTAAVSESRNLKTKEIDEKIVRRHYMVSMPYQIILVQRMVVITQHTVDILSVVSGTASMIPGSVDNIPVSRIGGSQAYILFYERVDTSSSL